MAEVSTIENIAPISASPKTNIVWSRKPSQTLNPPTNLTSYKTQTQTQPGLEPIHQTDLQPPRHSLTLKVSRKDRNSPILSIQKFIYAHFGRPGSNYSIGQKIPSTWTTQKLWEQYVQTESNSLIVKEHDLDFAKFKDIAEPILENLKLYQVEFRPIFSRLMTNEKINNSMCTKII